MNDVWTPMQFVIGILVAFAGFIMVWKADWFLRNFGSIPFAEKHLWTSGGSRLFYKLLGIVIMIGGFMYATGLLQPTMQYLVDNTIGSYFQEK